MDIIILLNKVSLFTVAAYFSFWLLYHSLHSCIACFTFGNGVVHATHDGINEEQQLQLLFCIHYCPQGIQVIQHDY
jgi:hypothetical protein